MSVVANTISLTSGQPHASAGGEMTGTGAGDKRSTPTSSTILKYGVDWIAGSGMLNCVKRTMT